MSLEVFREKVVVISGASSGIGREMALQLASQGANLVLGARREELLGEVAEECGKRGGRAVYRKTDVTSKEDARALINLAVEKFARLDALINNAGITMYSPFEEIKDLSVADRIIQVNFLGSVYLTYFALPYLKETRGRLVAVSSLTGKTGVPTRSLYAASKHAMAGFFDSLRIELRKYGVSVTVLYPGFVKTPIRENALGPDGKPLGKSHIREEGAMDVEEAVRKMLTAVAKRKRELVMGTRAKIGLWLKLIAPSLVDRMAEKSISSGKT